MKNASMLKSRNLQIFKHRFPDVHRHLEGHKPTSRLVSLEDGSHDVLRDGTYVYSKNPREYTARQLAGFSNFSDRFLTSSLKFDAFDPHTNLFHRTLARRADAEGLSFLLHPRTSESFFLILFGIGLGPHIEELIRKTECLSVLCIEPDLDFLHHSLEVLDWERSLAPLYDRGGEARFVINDDPQIIEWFVREHMRRVNPCSISGFRFFLHYPSPTLEQAISLMKTNAGHGAMLFGGLGDFTDEIVMLKNAHNNLRSGKARVYSRAPPKKIDVPVFIVGSGPSLDAHLSSFREIAADAVIISCASALRPLTVNGITPDFHFEIENINVDIGIAQVAASNDLSPVRLVCSVTVEPSIFRYFKESFLCFRSSHCTYPLFSNSVDNCLLKSEPAVINAALSFAQEVGFQEIYFLGVDLGQKEGDTHHHSRETWFYTDEGIKDGRFQIQMPIPVTGNFGGNFRTSAFFHVTRENLERAIAEIGPDCRYFNCSDGVRIAGAAPQLMEMLTLAKTRDGKKRAVAEIRTFFPVYPKRRFAAAWDRDALTSEIDAFVEELVRFFTDTEDFQDKGYLLKLMALLKPWSTIEDMREDPKGAAVMVLFRGTVMAMIIILEYYLSRASTPEQALRLAEVGRQEFTGYIGKLRDVAIGVVDDTDTALRHLEETLADVSSRQGDTPKWTRPIPRNEPCPCGSGEKYKRCHGHLEAT